MLPFEKGLSRFKENDQDRNLEGGHELSAVFEVWRKEGGKLNDHYHADHDVLRNSGHDGRTSARNTG